MQMIYCLQGVFDLRTGSALGRLVKEMQADIAKFLPYSQFSRFIQDSAVTRDRADPQQSR